MSGRFRGLNHARLRRDDVYVPDFDGVIETDDGALLAFHLTGLARKSDYGREVTGSIVHIRVVGDHAHTSLVPPVPEPPQSRS